jgi:NAD(P)-dependent dehydrogenase (short-subunit alcohol dehydrogenase family)
VILAGKTAFITGGSGALGQALVRVFAREGCAVAFSYLSGAELAAGLAEELTATGHRVAAWPLDVTDRAACGALAQQIEREFGSVDILVNNAGIAQIMPFAMIEEDDWDHTLDVNVKGMFLVTKAFARGMIRRKAGAVVNMGSLAGLRMLEVPVHYATAKSAVLGFTVALAREWGRYGIRVNAVAPGMLRGGVGLQVPEKQRDEYNHYCALSRAGEPAEAAELVAFLASDRASYINGQVILIDGGI